jgi:hypothetical protein
MKTKTYRSGLAALVMGLALASAAPAAEASLKLVTEPNHWAVPYDVNVERSDDGAVISGMLRKSAANPSRRLISKVKAEVLNRTGQVLAVYYAKPRRMSPAKHSYRARFDIEIERLPEAASEIRVRYH